MSNEWTLEIFFITGDIRSGMTVEKRYMDYMAKKNQNNLNKMKNEVITTKCQAT